LLLVSQATGAEHVIAGAAIGDFINLRQPVSGEGRATCKEKKLQAFKMMFKY
jgi:hypothetical protein